MEANVKKTVLRMIPYGLYVLTAAGEGDRVAAATVNWVMQSSFDPPQVALAVKVGSSVHEIIKGSRVFALNVLGKGQQATAFAFFKSAERSGNMIGPEPFRTGTTGAPILENAAAFIECRLVDVLERGDHSVFLGEVVEVGLQAEVSGRPDEAILLLKELGEKIFYGG